MATTAGFPVTIGRAQTLALTATCLNLAITIPLALFLNVWQDDAYTLHSTGTGVAYAFHEAIGFEQNAPLYFVAMALWRDINHSAVFARLFSVLCAALTVWLFAAFAERYLPRADSRWIVLTVAINPLLIWSALEIRLYALVICIAMLLLLTFYDGFLREDRDRKAQVLYALCAAAAVYSQYYLAFLIAAQGVYLLVWKRRALPAFAACAAAAAILFAPMLATVPAQVANFRGAFTPPHSPIDSGRVLLGSLVRYVLPLDFLPHATAVYAVLIALAVVAALVFRRFFGRDGDAIIVRLTALAFAIFATGIYAAKVHLLNRHAASLFVPAVAFPVAVLSYLRPSHRAKAIAAWCAIVAAASIVLLIWTYRSGAKPGDWQRVAVYIEARETAGEPIAVFQAENALPFEYYYHGRNAVYAIPRGVDFEHYDVSQFVVRDETAISRALPRAATRLWWIDAGECAAANIEFGCGTVERYIAREYRTVSTAQFYESDVRLLERRK